MSLYRTLARSLVAIFIIDCAAQAEDFATPEAAYNAGVKHLNDKEYAGAQAAFEAALQLAPDDSFRLKTYQPLTQCYRQLPEPEKMIEAQEFLVRHSERAGERKSAAGSLVAFLHQRGLLDKHIERYQTTLKNDADDLTAVSLLAAAYGSARRDAGNKEEFEARLKKLELPLSAKLAEKREAEATAQPERAWWHWKEAAVAWRDAGNQPRALAAAEKAELPEAKPDGFGLVHFYHRHLGEVYADCGRPTKAVEHLEKAIAATQIKGYKDDCQKRLDTIRAKLQP